MQPRQSYRLEAMPAINDDSHHTGAARTAAALPTSSAYVSHYS